MLESFVVPLHFTIEFLGFLVAAGGAILAVTRRSLVPGEPSNRFTVAFGFMVLALAQVLHGGSFEIAEYSFETDGGEQLLVAARAVGLAFVFVGVSGGLRGSSVGAVFAVKAPALFMPAGAALLLAGSAFAGSLRNGPKAYRRLAIGALLIAAGEAATAFDPRAVIGAGPLSGFAYAAHGFKVLGFLSLGAWLWSAVRSSIRVRFVASFAALLVMVVLALSSALTGVLTNSVETEKLGQLELQLTDVVKQLEETDVQSLSAQVAVAAGDDNIQTLVSRGGNLNGVAQQIRALEFLEFDFVMITDAKGLILGFDGTSRLRAIDRVGIAGSKVVLAVVNGDPAAASPIQVGRDTLVHLAARRVPSPAGAGAAGGVLIGGRYIDAQFLEGISSRVAASASLVLDRRTVASTLPRPVRDERLIPTTVNQEISAVEEPVSSTHTLGGRSYFSAFAVVEAQDGSQVAKIVLSSPARDIVATREALTRTLFIVAMVVGSIALLLAYFSGRRITRPIQSLTTTAGAIREGDLSAQAQVSGDDEVGRLGETFNEMTSSLFKMTNDLRSAAREEHRLRARIETIMQSMADGLVATDAEHKVLAFNREAELLTGLKSRHAMGKPVADVLRAVDANGDRVPLPIFEHASGSVDNIYLERKNGHRVPVAVVSAVLTAEEGEVAGAVAVLRDMSREREVERMKSEFLANISHELRTPLTPIKGYAEILGRKEVPPDKVKKFVGGILEGTARLERIIQLLVDFSAMEAGRLAPRNKPIDIGDIINGLAVQWDARTPNHSVVADVGPSLPKVSGDERLLRRSLEEVLDNAVKFSPQGGTIRLEARGAGATDGERRHRHVEVTVSDEGIGIPPEDLPKIFSDFHQLDGSETRSYGGLGLGLAFVQRIVEAHDGSISVESELDEGTRLTISIPAAIRSRKQVDAANGKARDGALEGDEDITEDEEVEEPVATGPQK